MTAGQQPASKSAVFAYAVGSFATGVFSTVPAVLLLYYCTQTLGLPVSWAAAVVFVPKAWALVWDPFVGNWSDRRHARTGQRIPFMLAGTIIVPLAFVALFNIPGNSTLAAISVGTAYFVLAIGYSLFAVPYVAIPAERPTDRARLLSWRLALAMAGALTGAGLAPHLVADFGGGRHGYGVMAILIAVFCGAAMLTTVFGELRRPQNERISTTEVRSPKVSLVAVLRNSVFIRLAFAYALMLSGIGVVSAGVPYYIGTVLHQSDAFTGTIIGLLFLFAMLTMPLWAAAMRHRSNYALLVTAVVGLSGLTLMLLLIPTTNNSAGLLVVFALLGWGFAGLQLLPFTMMAQLAGEAGAGGAGLYAGLWTAAEKLGLGAGPAAVGLGLGLAGFVSGRTSQSLATTEAVVRLIAVGPLAFFLPALLLLPRARHL